MDRYEANLNLAASGLVRVALAVQQRLSELIAELGYLPEDLESFSPEKEHHARAIDIVADMLCDDAIRSIVEESIPTPTCDSDADDICEIGRELVKDVRKWSKP
jgi:hypothetical protein